MTYKNRGREVACRAGFEAVGQRWLVRQSPSPRRKLSLTSILLNSIICNRSSILLSGEGTSAMSKSTAMLLAWLEVLEEEDVRFLRRFLLCSGSLKALAE